MSKDIISTKIRFDRKWPVYEIVLDLVDHRIYYLKISFNYDNYDLLKIWGILFSPIHSSIRLRNNLIINNNLNINNNLIVNLSINLFIYLLFVASSRMIIV